MNNTKLLGIGKLGESKNAEIQKTSACKKGKTEELLIEDRTSKRFWEKKNFDFSTELNFKKNRQSFCEVLEDFCQKNSKTFVNMK